MANDLSTPARTRRTYSAQFKAEIVAQCRSASASVASVGLAHGINDNILHRWLREHDRRSVDSQTALTPLRAQPAFIALSMPAPVAPIAPAADIQLQLQRGDIRMTVSWPMSESDTCAAWLRAVLA